MFEIIITSVILISIFVGLFKDWLSPTILFMLGLSLLVIFGVLEEKEALAGFQSNSLIIIGSLLVLASASREAFDTSKLTSRLMGNHSNIQLSLARLLPSTALASAFVANTPVVAILIEPVINWANKHEISPSKILIPLSYASIFGGTLTLIGTSTNIVASGYLESSGQAPIGFFEFTPITLPMVILLTIALVFLAPKILPSRRHAQFSEKDIANKFTVSAKVDQKLVGKSISQAGLRNLQDAYLVTLIRQNGDEITPVKPATKLLKGDTLLFSGPASTLSKLKKLNEHLRPLEQKHLDEINNVTYYEAVVGHSSSITNGSLKDIGFRSKYNAAVLAVFRAGKAINKPLGQTTLKTGDSVLLVSDENFRENWENTGDFLYIRQVEHHPTRQKQINKNMVIILALAVGMIIAGVDLAPALLFSALLTVVLKIHGINSARKAIDFDLLIMIGAAIGVAKAVESSGIASEVSAFAVNSFGSLGIIGLIFGLVLSATVLTELITNNAAALLVLPLAIASASEFGVDARGLIVAVTIAASMSLLTPLGYQTNTMVYSAGGYTFKDFIRIGLPLNILSTILIVLFVYIAYYS